MSDLQLGRYLLKNVDVTSIVSSVFELLLLFIVYSQVAKKAGFTRWWAFALFVPVLGSLLPILLAWSRWPIEKRTQSKPRRRRKRTS